MINLREGENIFMKMVAFMKARLKMVKKMEMENFFIIMEI